MRYSTGARRNKDLTETRTEDVLLGDEKRRDVKVLSDIEKQLVEIHEQIDRIEEIIRKAFNDNAA